MPCVVSQLPEIALATLAFLPWQSLAECALVCQRWAKISKHLLAQPHVVATICIDSAGTAAGTPDQQLCTFVSSLPFRPSFASPSAASMYVYSTSLLPTAAGPTRS